MYFRYCNCTVINNTNTSRSNCGGDLLGSELHLSVSNLLDDTGLALLVVELVLSHVLVAGSGLNSVTNNGSLDVAGGLLLEDRVGTDGSVSRLVHFLNLVASDASLDELGELTLEGLGVLVLQVLHVVGNMLTEDSLLVNLGVVLAVLALTRVSGESSDGVGNVDSAVASTLEGTEESGTDSGSVQTAVQHSLERSALALEVIRNVELVTGGLLLANKSSVHTDLLQQTSGQKETSCVSRGVVLQTDGDAVSGELRRDGLSEDSVALDGGIDDLADDLAVGSADNETVLMGVVLVLILLDQGSSLSIIGLVFTSTSVLGLESLVVSVGLNCLHESHGSET
jgi:hypothetical protein